MTNRMNRILNHAPPSLVGAMRALRALYKDERGQSTTEYILILSIVVMVAMKFKGALNGRIESATGKVFENLDKVVEP